jgi:hypothetical protein
MFICIPGDGDGLGEAWGICLPGIFIFISGDGEGDGVGDGEGITISGKLRISSCFGGVLNCLSDFSCCGAGIS